MTIKPCPHCVEYTHFDGQPRVARCWHCCTVANFAKQRTPEEKMGAFLSAQMQILLWPLHSCARLQKLAPLALLAALPFAVVMLLVCNSLEIKGVRELAEAFLLY